MLAIVESVGKREVTPQAHFQLLEHFLTSTLRDFMVQTLPPSFIDDWTARRRCNGSALTYLIRDQSMWQHTGDGIPSFDP
jgi:hypothetical protein